MIVLVLSTQTPFLTDAGGLWYECGTERSVVQYRWYECGTEQSVVRELVTCYLVPSAADADKAC